MDQDSTQCAVEQEEYMNDITNIESKILVIMGQQVMLDRDLAGLYGVETKVLNQAVKRNIERFPDRFMFKLNKVEAESCSKSQFVTLNEKGNFRGQNIKKLPYAFTEQGVYMLEDTQLMIKTVLNAL